MTTCAREGCGRTAHGDLFCSTYCFKRSNGLLGYEPDDKKEEKRRRRIRTLKRKLGTTSIEVENTDAMTRLVPGSFEQGKQR